MKTSFNPHFDPRVDKTAFPDVRTISLDFLDDKLITLWIGYEGNIQMAEVGSVRHKLQQVLLSVPADWSVKGNGRQLACDGFSLFGIDDRRVAPAIRIIPMTPRQT